MRRPLLAGAREVPTRSCLGPHSVKIHDPIPSYRARHICERGPHVHRDRGLDRRRQARILSGVLACIVGIYVGDLLLYFAGRWIGRPIVRWKPLRKMLTPQKLDRASEWLSERGALVVILSRFTPGLRLPTYVAAGLLKTHFWTFACYFLVAATLWTPVLVGAAALLGKSLPHLAFLGPALLLLAAPFRKILSARPLWHTWRRAIGWIRRKTRWEFWPAWLAYSPWRLTSCIWA